MMQYVHGGDVYSYAERFGGQEVLDFSSNINPWGIAEPVRQAMRAAVDACVQYPDPFCRELTAALAEEYGLIPPMLFCANGAAEIFFRLADALRPKTALVTAPTFSEYEAALAWHGCAVRHHTLHAADDFAVTEGILGALREIDICFLCNPNNPTGRTIAPALLRRILAHCQQNDIWLVVDECFADFLTDEDAHSLLPLLRENDRLVVVRAFTKMYAVPGVRLGWCASANVALIERLYACGQPWGVSVIAQACGRAALTLDGYAKQAAQRIARHRSVLSEELSACGLRVFSGQVNYLLFYTDRLDLGEKLLPRRIMIRNCANYAGLSAGYFRVAVKTQAENAILIREIREVLANG